MKGYKGFDKDLKCRGLQYEVGKTVAEENAKLCDCGLHFCEQPIDVFRYYAPGHNSRYAEVAAKDVSKETEDDSKRVAKSITVKAEVGIVGLVKAQIEYVKKHTTFEHTDKDQATAGDYGAATAGDYGAATAGDSGAATAGYRGAATAGDSGAATAGDSGAATAGDYGAATAGDYGAATAGDYGAATAGDSGAATAGDYGAATAGDSGAATAGYRGAATAGDSGAATAGYRGAATAGDGGAATSRGTVSVGENGCGLVRGNRVKIKGGIGAILTICEEKDNSYGIAYLKSFVVDGTEIKADTYYSLKDGNPVEVEQE
ncbi:DUF7666 domain-containing protein [Megasphaera cerevisiae]|uniref:DUF7666 domain-containing protein n=1 Tax=Megasphaera cerevisiae TaxID=39029 RepID=UPI00099AA81A|nr:hypothetical protein [Megasphaera cerevisiae]SKA11586.1 hypothetical protein SAMN05660900_02472 [Megasphaera cerevisiae DSM 20462]